ncbi:MAG: UbiA family prenyltransferase [Chitinophagales bacterium]|nr:UbiA family prenyltransferase [Chitinophagales bacterium]
MRPYLLFISAVTAWAGMSVAPDYQLFSINSILTFIALFFAYGFGQALTDCFQVDTDKISAPYRPLSKGIVSTKSVATVSITGLFLITIVLVYLNLWNILLCVLSVAGLYTYTFVKRRVWWGGPFYNAWIVALLPIMGYLSISGKSLSALEDKSLQMLIVLSFFSYATFVLIGYLKDITADRESGYKTFPVVFGWNAAVWVSDIFIIISLISCFKLVQHDLKAIVISSIALIIYLTGQIYAHTTKQKVETNTVLPVTSTVRSFILLHLAVLLAFNPDNISILIAAGLFYIVFEITLAMRPEMGQI